jgi:glucose/arabinose dehydrogenase
MRRSALAAVLGSMGWLLALGAAPAAATVPAGFTDNLVAAVGAPTALAFTPDGRLLITTQGGTLRVYQGGALLPTPALTFSASQICTNSERGLLGVAVDPAFPCNNYIYLFYTAELAGGACVNRVSRYTLPASNVIAPASELVLIDNMPSPAGNHNAGDLHFGKDGNLYVAIGDGGCDWAGNSGCAGANDAARDEHVLTGKVLRITSAGGIPADNPFQGAGTARCNVTGSTTPGNRCQETYGWGLRNPFRLGFDQNAALTRFFVNDVGQGAWEEIDLGQAGADYGWNCREGAHTNSTTGPCSPTPPGMVDPVFEYQHGVQIPGTTSPTNCNCVSGGAFVPNGLWPGYDDAYLFGDCVCGGIFKLTQSGSVFSASDFGSGLGTVVHLLFGPHAGSQALYYTTYLNGGEVRRVTLDNPPADPLDYFTLAPCRLVDTRNATGPSGGPALQTCTTRTFPVAEVCGVPATAKAVAVNLTIVSPAGGGQIVAYPAGTLAPAASTTLSFSLGQTRANNAIVALATNGQIAVLPTISGSGTAHLVLDVVGYFE